MRSLPALAPPGYALVHVTASHKTTALCLSGFGVSSFLMSRTSVPSKLLIVDLNSDTTLYSLALLAKLLAYMTTIPRDRSLTSRRGFGHRNAEMHKTCAHRIPDIPMRDLPM
jgi:hypothetical protein